MVLQSKLYPDEDDFTSDHDSIFLGLLKRWKDVVETLDHDRLKWGLVEGDIKGEPRIDGYPPVFPDAVARGNFCGIHKIGHENCWASYPEKLTPDVNATFTIRCEECTFGRTVYPDFSKFCFPDEMEWAIKNGLVASRGEWYCCTMNDQQRKEQEAKEESIKKVHKEQYEKALLDWERARRVCIEKSFLDYLRDAGEAIFHHCGPRFCVVFEIKPKVESVGKVLRQLQEYRIRTKPGSHSDAEGDQVPDYLHWVVLVTNDLRYDDAFLSQGFQVHHPNDKENAKGSVDK